MSGGDKRGGTREGLRLSARTIGYSQRSFRRNSVSLVALNDSGWGRAVRRQSCQGICYGYPNWRSPGAVLRSIGGRRRDGGDWV